MVKPMSEARLGAQGWWWCREHLARVTASRAPTTIHTSPVTRLHEFDEQNFLMLHPLYSVSQW